MFPGKEWPQFTALMQQSLAQQRMLITLSRTPQSQHWVSYHNIFGIPAVSQP
jgi:hypothetical protein